MPLPEKEAQEVAHAARAADPTVDDWALFRAEYERRLAERHTRLERDARASWRAMDGWARVQTPEDWQNAVRHADEGLDNGSFLIERLGAERYLDPPMMAVLLALRRRLIDEQGATTAAELMMIDGAVLSYYHTLRINGWIGNLAVAAEGEFFGQASLTAKLEGEYGRNATVRGLRVEEIVQRLSEQLMPLLDRSNRIMLRNLKALKEHRRAPAPNVNISRAKQVNVGGEQVNVAEGGE